MSSVAANRWKIVCAYDGTAFSGWQSQPNRNGVQDIIETRLAEIFKTPLRIHGSGRTDAGVHAMGQVFHFDDFRICRKRMQSVGFHSEFR